MDVVWILRVYVDVVWRLRVDDCLGGCSVETEDG